MSKSRRMVFMRDWFSRSTIFDHSGFRCSICRSPNPTLEKLVPGRQAFRTSGSMVYECPNCHFRVTGRPSDDESAMISDESERQILRRMEKHRRDYEAKLVQWRREQKAHRQKEREIREERAREQERKWKEANKHKLEAEELELWHKHARLHEHLQRVVHEGRNLPFEFSDEPQPSTSMWITEVGIPGRRIYRRAGHSFLREVLSYHGSH